jgi:hypothetical protein
MTESARWIIAVIAALAIVALVLFARGGMERHDPEVAPSPTAVIAFTV